MNITLSENKNTFKIVILDLMLFSFIFFLPSISHYSVLPLYFLEPMRIALFTSMIFTSRKNTFFIALTLPLFSFLVSLHPPITKMLLISVELFLNALIFFKLADGKLTPFFAALVSLVTSKVIYYAIKYAIFGFILGESFKFGIPVYIQLIVIIMLSIFAGLFFKKPEEPNRD